MPPLKSKGFAKPKNAKKTISRLLKYIGNYKFLWIAVFVCVLISSAGSVIGGYLIKPALNDYIIPLIGKQNPDFSGFIKLLCKILCLFVVSSAASWTNSRIMLYISTNILFKIRVDLFSKLERLPIKFYDSHTHGELMSRFTNDADAMREMMSMTVPQLLSSSVTVIAVFAMMIVLSPMLTLVIIFTMFFIFKLIKAVGKKSAAAFRENQKSVGQMNGFIEEMIEGQKVIKVFNREKKATDEFKILNENLKKAGTAAMTYGGVLGPITNNTSHAQYAVAAIIASVFMILGQNDGRFFNWFTGVLNLGTIAAFLQYTRSFSQPISQISQQANSVLNALAGAERIFAIIDEKPESDKGSFVLVNAYDAKTNDGTTRLVQSYANTGEWAWKNPADNSLTRLKGEVSFNRVSFGYSPQKNVLYDICITAKPGMKIALVGSTGSGKTTTINLLSRFYDVPENCGFITYDGIPLNQISKASLRKSLGTVQQNARLFTGTIRENIRFGNLEASDVQIYEAAKLANADYFIRRLENGYDTVISGDGSSLSQGQRQLIAIARAAVANPPVLILDEATSSIDTRTEALIEKGMDGLMAGRTSFVIAHRLSTVRNADEIIVLERGNIIERGTHEQLIAQKGRYYFLYTGNKISFDE